MNRTTSDKILAFSIFILMILTACKIPSIPNYKTDIKLEGLIIYDGPHPIYKTVPLTPVFIRTDREHLTDLYTSFKDRDTLNAILLNVSSSLFKKEKPISHKRQYTTCTKCYLNIFGVNMKNLNNINMHHNFYKSYTSDDEKTILSFSVNEIPYDSVTITYDK